MAHTHVVEVTKDPEQWHWVPEYRVYDFVLPALMVVTNPRRVPAMTK